MTDRRLNRPAPAVVPVTLEGGAALAGYPLGLKLEPMRGPSAIVSPASPRPWYPGDRLPASRVGYEEPPVCPGHQAETVYRPTVQDMVALQVYFARQYGVV